MVTATSPENAAHGVERGLLARKRVPRCALGNGAPTPGASIRSRCSAGRTGRACPSRLPCRTWGCAFGSAATPTCPTSASSRRLVFDVNDFDDTLPGPAGRVGREAAPREPRDRRPGPWLRAQAAAPVRPGGVAQLPQGDGRVRGDGRHGAVVCPARHRIVLRGLAELRVGGRPASLRQAPGLGPIAKGDFFVHQFRDMKGSAEPEVGVGWWTRTGRLETVQDR